MATYIIPLSPKPQTLTISLSGKQYRLTVKWNVSAACWVVDIFDAGDVAILTGIPLVTGGDLLAPYDYLNLGGSLIAFTDHAADLPPTFKNLGVTGHVYWVTQ